MMNVSIYTKGSGYRPIIRTLTNVDKDALDQLPADQAFIEGIWPDNIYAVLDGQAVECVRQLARVELVQAIKTEARSRITDRWPIAKQLNMQAEGGERYLAMRAEIDAIRAASNALEAMDPIPDDYADPKWWPERTAE